MENNEKRQGFANRLNAILKENGMSQSDLAKKLNIAKSSVNGWCKGTAYPRIDKITELAYIFHVDPAYLITGEKPYIISVDAEKFAQAMKKKEPSLLKQIATSFTKLNEKGQEKAASYVKDLTKIPEYKKTE